MFKKILCLFLIIAIVSVDAFEIHPKLSPLKKNIESEIQTENIKSEVETKKLDPDAQTGTEISEVDQTVRCINFISSVSVYPSVCQSETPFPIYFKTSVKTKANITWYGYEDWDFSLGDQNGKIIDFDKSSCYWSEPSAGKKASGYILALSGTCFKAPKTLAYGDHLYIQVMIDDHHKDSQYLAFVIPIPGYSTPQTLNQIYKDGLPQRPKTQKTLKK